jgi:two-component system, NarL family, response regulator NreC
MDRKIRILLVDDHRIVRQGIRNILNTRSDIEVVGEAANGQEAIDACQNLSPDVIVMDLAMPVLNGIEATRRIRQIMPRTHILALSMHRDSVYVREILRAGAKGYLLKDASDDDLVSAIHALARGEGYISSAVADTVLSDYQRQVTSPIDLLSSREREVLQLIAEGKTNKEVASALNLSIHTVDAHRGRIMDKLNLHSIGEIVRFAIKNGLVE